MRFQAYSLIALLILNCPQPVLSSELKYSQRVQCQPEKPTDPKIYSSDFGWGMSLEKLVSEFKRFYASPKRLTKRAYWSAEKNALVLPYNESRGGDVVITDRFVRQIAQHIELAYQMKYIDAVFFPDMGHSHILIRKDLWDKKYNLYPINEFNTLYQEMFEDPESRVVYHTAEQLQLIDKNQNVLPDPYIKWRHKTRNLIGSNKGVARLALGQNPKSKNNTLEEVRGYYWWGGGFNLSANENGCFSYQKDGMTYYFDLSLYDLPSQGQSDFGVSF